MLCLPLRTIDFSEVTSLDFLQVTSLRIIGHRRQMWKLSSRANKKINALRNNAIWFKCNGRKISLCVFYKQNIQENDGKTRAPSEKFDIHLSNFPSHIKSYHRIYKFLCSHMTLSFLIQNNFAPVLMKTVLKKEFSVCLVPVVFNAFCGVGWGCEETWELKFPHSLEKYEWNCLLNYLVRR